MIRDWLWRLLEFRLRRTVPPAHLASVLGDLAEDYVRCRSRLGWLRARIWLLREVRSLTSAYRHAATEPRSRLTVLDDTRHAWKRLASRPVTALVCTGLLAIGTGLTTAMFSVVDALLLQPAPFRDADRLVRQTFFRPEPAVMAEWRASGIFEAVEAARLAPVQVESESGGPWRGALVTPGAFELLGVRPALGRLFIPGSGGGLAEVLLSDVIWGSAFGRDPSVLGRTVRLGGKPAMVVGIMPRDFRFPDPMTLAWSAFDPSAASTGPATILGRLREGVPLADAEVRTSAIARRVANIPRNYRNGSGAPPFRRIGDAPLGEFIESALWLLFAGVALVFIVLCANVSSLLLARLDARRRDFAVCTALGAARWRLMRQAMAEHAFIGILGAIAGIGLASMLTSRVPDAFLGRTLNPIDLDLRAMVAAVAIGIASVVLAGLLPAWLGTRTDPLESVRRATPRQTGVLHRLSRNTLVVAQTALACALLVGSAFLVQSFVNLSNADRGLQTEGVTHVRLDLRGISGAGSARALALAAVKTQFSSSPGIRAVALSQELPPVSGGGGGNLRANEGDEWIASDGYRVGASFFGLYGIRILGGRAFEPVDTDREVIIGERLAAGLWPGDDPVGRSIAIGRHSGRVIGVASEISLPTLDASLDRPEFYQPLESHADDVYLSIRCADACPDEPAVRSLVAAANPAIRPRMIPSWENQYLEHLRLPRATAQAGGLFAMIAVLTAAGGLFSLLTYAVAQRRREFGIRTALGASPVDLTRLVFRDGLAVAGAGLAIGALGGWIVVRSLAAFHYGVTSGDPFIWAGVLGTIALVSLTAAWPPALEAMRVDPVRLLREE